MRKVKYLILILLLIESCSGSRNITKSGSNGYEGEAGSVILEDVIRQNLSYKSFNIDKAIIDINTGNETESLLASIKFRKPDNFLISLRTKIGVEIARIYLTEDTVLVNDRINKKLMYGKPVYLERKYGIRSELIPLLFGDMILDQNFDKKNSGKCIKGNTNISSIIGGMEITYNIDCRRSKVGSALIRNIEGTEVISVNCEKFFRGNDNVQPSKIQIHDKLDDIRISLRIEKFNTNDEGRLEFIPGNRYEMIKLK